MLELQKALADNSICRAPAVLSYSKEDMADLYRLHIRSCEHPPLFATLLQLQEMLGLSQEEAEKIELELMTIPGATTAKMTFEHIAAILTSQGLSTVCTAGTHAPSCP